MRKQISFSQLHQVGDVLREARVTKSLTQRELGDRVGLPQSHVSKIEQGAVDLQLSSLSELARALDLELKLVPRAALPAVEGVVRTFAHDPADGSTSAARATLEPLARIGQDIATRHPDFDGLGRFQRTLDELALLRFDPTSFRALQEAAAAAKKLRRFVDEGDPRKLGPALERATDALRAFRNAHAHSPPTQLPAHSLDEDEDD